MVVIYYSELLCTLTHVNWGIPINKEKDSVDHRIMIWFDLNLVAKLVIEGRCLTCLPRFTCDFNCCKWMWIHTEMCCAYNQKGACRTVPNSSLPMICNDFSYQCFFYWLFSNLLQYCYISIALFGFVRFYFLSLCFQSNAHGFRSSRDLFLRFAFNVGVIQPCSFRNFK